MAKTVITYDNEYYSIIENKKLGNKNLLVLQNRDTKATKRIQVTESEYAKLMESEKTLVESFQCKANESWKPVDKRPWSETPELLAHYILGNASSVNEALARVYYGADVCSEEFIDSAKSIIIEKFIKKDEKLVIENNYNVVEELGKLLKQPNKPAMQELANSIIESFRQKYKEGELIMLDIFLEELQTRTVLIKNKKFGQDFSTPKINRRELMSIIESAPDDMVKTEINKYVNEIAITQNVKDKVKDVNGLISQIKDALELCFYFQGDPIKPEKIDDTMCLYKANMAYPAKKESWLIFDYTDITNLKVFGYINNAKAGTLVNKSHIANFTQFKKFMAKYEITIRTDTQDKTIVHPDITPIPILGSK